MRGRIVPIFAVIVFLFGGLFFRLFALTQQEEITQVAQRQSNYSLKVLQRRGEIYDSNLKPLVNQRPVYLASVAPSPQAYEALKGHVEDTQGLLAKIEKKQPFVVEVDTDTILCKGVEVFESAQRYSGETLAPHIIGYVDMDGVGVSGVEKAYNDFLTQNMPTVKVQYQLNGTGRLADKAAAVNKENMDSRRGVVLTLDRTIQQIAQNAAKSIIGKGAVVVMDVNTGDIKASVSVPEFSQTDVASVLKDESSPLFNRAFGAYNVGSSFKLCTGAAALERNVPISTVFNCIGAIDVGGQIFHCHNRAGHGVVNMKKAMEISCNPYFIHLAGELGGLPVSSMAAQMGFGKAGIPLGSGMASASGYLPTMQDLVNPADVGNFGFGQGKLMATPVQVAQMVSSVANGGYSVSARLVSGFTDESGTAIVEQTATVKPARIFSKQTSDILRDFMVGVVEEGSGKKARPDQGGAGGKTASAQTGTYDENGKEIVQAWFTGYYPAQTPKYAIVVLNEGMESGGDYAAPVFREICNGLYRMGY